MAPQTATIPSVAGLQELEMGRWFLLKTEAGAPGWMEHVLEYNRELTFQITEAEARGGNKAVDRLLGAKNWVNRLREIRHAGC